MILAAEVPAEPTVFLHITEVVNLVVLVTAVAVLVQRRNVHKSPATGWAIAMFAIFALVLIAGFVEVEDDGTLLRHGYTVALVSLLLLIPYLLVRFAYALGAVSTLVHQVAVGVTAVVIVCTLFSPRFPEPGETRTDWFTVYVVLVVGAWTLQSVLAAYGLWSAGKGQPAVVKNRMRTLAIGAVVIALALVSSAGSEAPGTATQVVTTLIAVLGIGLLVLAFVVPTWLRSAWRSTDLERLGATERELMAAVNPQQVADAIVPGLVQLFGADGAVVLDGKWRIIRSQGVEADAVARLRGELSTQDPGTRTVLTDGGFASRLGDGWVAVVAGTFAPVFGAAELSLLERVSTFASLAVERSRLFEEEAVSRRTAEAATGELQTLLYSVSHDLRNPVLSILGYLDVLAQEHAGQLQGEGDRYLQRISVNAVYMQNLIQDLLELSRIGRSEPAPREVALGALAESVAQEVHVVHPSCDISVSGSFPVVWMSELRARQLFTNLIENAAKHAQGEPHVTVWAEGDGDGRAVVLISDNGKGVPARHRQKVFEVFERLDATDAEVPGTGMGLPICKRIVESIGGTIVLEGPPTGVPSGTTVRITLPASVVRMWTVAPSTDREHA